MHSNTFKDDEGREWTVVHNGDWSGNADLRRIVDDPDAPNGFRVEEEHTIPGALIRKACAASVVSAAISMLEQWDGSQEAASDAVVAWRRKEQGR